MQAAVKYMSPAITAANRSTLTDLGRSKLYELMVLDDEPLAALADGGTVAGLTLDDIDRMSSRELRAALRDSRSSTQAQARLLAEKSKKIDDLATDLAKKSQKSLLVQVAVADPEEHAHQLRAELSRRVYGIEVSILGDLSKAIDALREHARNSGEPVHDLISGHLNQIAGDIESLMLRYGTDIPRGRATPDADIWDAVNADIEAKAARALDDDEDQVAPLN
jgi:hypothetical protein